MSSYQINFLPVCWYSFLVLVSTSNTDWSKKSTSVLGLTDVNTAQPKSRETNIDSLALCQLSQRPKGWGKQMSIRTTLLLHCQLKKAKDSGVSKWIVSHFFTVSFTCSHLPSRLSPSTLSLTQEKTNWLQPIMQRNHIVILRNSMEKAYYQPIHKTSRQLSFLSHPWKESRQGQYSQTLCHLSTHVWKGFLQLFLGFSCAFKLVHKCSP